MSMKAMLKDFETHCDNSMFPGSNKAPSYRRSIQYIIEYFGVQTLDEDFINFLIHLNYSIKDSNTAEYKKLFFFLNQNQRLSYLTKGWIKASIPHFLDYWYQKR